MAPLELGTAGWLSAETFLLSDAGFLKVTLALEDGLSA